jgi:hypothetical protein
MTIRVFDPTFDETMASAASPTRLTALAGCSVGLLDNGKLGARELLDYVEEVLRFEHGVVNVLRIKKPDASRPAPADVIAALSRCDGVISAVGD